MVGWNTKNSYPLDIGEKCMIFNFYIGNFVINDFPCIKITVFFLHEIVLNFVISSNLFFPHKSYNDKNQLIYIY